jgi:hypothetical protein
VQAYLPRPIEAIRSVANFLQRYIQLDLARDSNDLARLNGFNVREPDGQVWQEVFQTIRSRDMGSCPARSKISGFLITQDLDFSDEALSDSSLPNFSTSNFSVDNVAP